MTQNDRYLTIKNTNLSNNIVITGTEGLRTLLSLIKGTWGEGNTVKLIFEDKGDVIFQPTEEPYKPVKFTYEIQEVKDASNAGSPDISL